MDMNVLIAVFVIWGVAAVTPGPNFFITVHTAVGSNRRLSMFTVLGIVTGTFVWSISGFLGISLLFKTAPILYYSLKLLGGVYLIYIGLNLLFQKKVPKQDHSIKYRSALDCFRLGLLTNLLNPKTAIFMTSLFAATIPASASPALGMLCVVTICVISATWYSMVASIFSHEMARKSYERQKQIIGKLAGAIFIGYGIKLAASK